VSGEDENQGESSRVFELKEAERLLLLRACQRYRAGIPAYLKSGEEERILLDRLIERLS
jgi:hypothetical protein